MDEYFVDSERYPLDSEKLLEYDILQIHLKIGSSDERSGLPSEGTIIIDEVDDDMPIDEALDNGVNMEDIEKSYYKQLTDILKSGNFTASDIMDKIKASEGKWVQCAWFNGI